MLTLAQIRSEKKGEVAPKGFKAWFTKNKGVVLIGGAVVVVAGGFIAYKTLFKKKSSAGIPGSTGNIGAKDGLGDAKIEAIEFD